MTVFLAPLRPLADVLYLTAEAAAALGTVSVAAFSLVLARVGDSTSDPRLPDARSSSSL